MDGKEFIHGDGKMRFSTKAIHTGEEPNYEHYGDVITPIHLSTTFARKDPKIPTKGYEYTRTDNPTRHVLEEKLASIENAKHGLAFSSGLAAETTLLLSIFKAGDEILAFEDLYGGTRRLFNTLSNYNISYKMIDLFSIREIKSNINSKTRILWVESPSNPLLRVLDIKELAEFSHENDILLVVDNTFATPYFQNPLSLGGDVVIHSTTKYISGHSDALGGAVVLNDDDLYGKIKFNQNAYGAVLSPFDSFLTMRGMKTLEIRMKQHEKNAMIIAEFLQERNEIEKVIYPGLPSHPQHQIAKKQMRGFGGMVSFYFNGSYNSVKLFISKLKYFSLAESLGGVESLLELPYYMTHSGLPEEEKKKLNITENLVRMSVGIENIEDLKEDIENALRF